jgi:hypothetical protein
MEGTARYDPLLGDLDEVALPDAEQKTPAEELEAQAARIAKAAVSVRDDSAAAWLYFVTNASLGSQIGMEAFLTYRDALLGEAGKPTDPVERMLLEQMALAHFSIGQLRMRSCATDLPQREVAYADAATRLLAEFRRCALALEEYRTKRAARTEKRGSSDNIKPTELAKVNGHTKTKINGNGNRHAAKLGSYANGDMPQWLKNRMAYPTLDASQLAAATASNGKG